MNRTRRSFLGVSTGAAAGLLGLAGAGTAMADDGRTRRLRGLVGAWDVVTTVVQQNAVFPALLTFTSDGIVLADEPPSPFETTGHGNWISTGRRTAAFTFHTLVGSAEGRCPSASRSSGSWSSPRAARAGAGRSTSSSRIRAAPSCSTTPGRSPGRASRSSG